MRAAVFAVIVLASSGTTAFARGGAFALPPAEVDVGTGTAFGTDNVGPSLDVLVGVHFASAYWKPTRIDVGVGYVGSVRDTLPMGMPVAERTGPTYEEPDHHLRLNGGYFDIAYAIESHAHWRTWLATRIELFDGNVNGRDFHAVGAAARLSTEVFQAGVAGYSDHNSAAVAAGTIALGIYVEASHRNLPDDLGPTGVSAGLSIRLPFLAAVAD